MAFSICEHGRPPRGQRGSGCNGEATVPWLISRLPIGTKALFTAKDALHKRFSWVDLTGARRASRCWLAVRWVCLDEQGVRSWRDLWLLLSRLCSRGRSASLASDVPLAVSNLGGDSDLTRGLSALWRGGAARAKGATQASRLLTSQGGPLRADLCMQLCLQQNLF